MTLQSDTETRSFQAEAAQILDLMAHSLYSNKEIFLRELISNASDAIDRLRFERYADPGPADGESDDAPRIRISFDKDAGTVTIADNGIGMSRQEVIDNIGTIARSGTADFLRSLTGDQRRDAELIGQFGVGFYSAFVVADRVVLTTRRAGLPASEGVRWSSDGKGEYALEAVERAEHGTTIVLELRESEDELLSEYRLRSIVQRYSDHITQPIVLSDDDTAVNQASALWTRPRSELSEQDYHSYYRNLTHDYSDPLAHVHTKVEGRYEYTLLLYIPSRAPHDLWLPQTRGGLRLHVRRVFILEDTGQLLPDYLRFVRGVVDSADLPLNVSREILQSSHAVDHIRSSAVKRVLKLLGGLAADEPGKYADFWKEFGGVLKQGVADDPAHREDLVELLRFTSTRSGTQDADVSLADYVDRMKDGQDKIYYLLAPGQSSAAASPHLEAYRAKDIEVLLLSEAVDGFVVSGPLQEYRGKRLRSVTQGPPDFGTLEDEAEKEAADRADSDYAALLGLLKAHLAGKAYDVRVTSRLTTSPACIVADGVETDFTTAQRLRGSGLPNQPILEINPGHPLVRRLNEDRDDPRLAEWAHVLFDQSVLTAGARIEEPTAFVTRLNELLLSLTGDGSPDASD
ncbi:MULTISPECIES: molecular chaperone HtpG [Streptomyces]|uniref:Chaperone protein HtpG n=1 Tax=Streptomyces tsukubensis (strain DSM 42081 / NBRC 108919 / NRRL 18488 / 9993) TaxID=1114943 RepID=A0A7G3UL76_STRT9|nr:MULTISPECIES: molecular chaperone HtpG [Streptomyces]AZK92612.1 molecular chaperone HtpG [Streptomyces tsukubensis]MYS64019.1 molecular chaperone HtpG [Streptomyces sp. SID5473]QKM71213.1 molecular chaperone HtpG [Streptomyces tsukubensis NRRL18488]TAI40377.1 molecular chaperone HtpG [Streptomyces tsukubensis]